MKLLIATLVAACMTTPVLPEPAPLSTAPPGANSPAPAKCEPTTPLAPLTTKTAMLDEGTSESEGVDAAVQFLARVGIKVATVDRVSHVVVSDGAVGQTILSTCGINEYHGLTFHIAIAGRAVNVAIECTAWMGWEDHYEGGVFIPKKRDPIVCGYLSEADSKLPQMIADGVVGVASLRKLQR